MRPSNSSDASLDRDEAPPTDGAPDADASTPEARRSRATSMIRRTAAPRTPPTRPEEEAPPASGRVTASHLQPVAAEPQTDPAPGAPSSPEPLASTPTPPISIPAVVEPAIVVPEPLASTPTPPLSIPAVVEPAIVVPEPAASTPTPPPSSVPPPTPSAGERSMLADPTQRPPDATGDTAPPPPQTVRAAKPLLASEALMEDLAPVEPARDDARAWCLVCGTAFVIFGALPLAGVVPGALAASLPWLVTGVISLLAAVFQVGYRQRAVAMLVLGLLTGLVALQESPVLREADGGLAWGAARILAVVSLSAALLFRARYRAYRGARILLGTALVLAVPYGIHVVATFSADTPFGAAHLGAAAVLLAIAATLVGFMGAETTGAGPYLAFLLVTSAGLELASRGIAVVGLLGGRLPSLVSVMVAAAGFGAAAGFTALGLFQILAWRFAADARRIDLHSPPRDLPPRSQRDPVSDWSTRE